VSPDTLFHDALNTAVQEMQGTKCNFCPLFATGRSDDKIIAGSDPIVLEMIDSPNKQSSR
jgi:hypothetical protein